MNIQYIADTVCQQLNIPIDAMKSKSRKRELVEARQLSMYFCKDYKLGSLKTIGMFFGGRDHSTVIHAIQTVEDLTMTSKSFKKTYNEIDIVLEKGFAENETFETIDKYSFAMLSLASV